MGSRECPYCGKLVFDRLTQCSFCRETLPESWSSGAKKGRRARPEPDADWLAETADRKVHKGLLFMLLAGVIGYFGSGSSALKLPVAVPQVIVSYLSLLLFLGGLGLCVYGLYLRHRSLHQTPR